MECNQQRTCSQPVVDIDRHIKYFLISLFICTQCRFANVRIAKAGPDKKKQQNFYYCQCCMCGSLIYSMMGVILLSPPMSQNTCAVYAVFVTIDILINVDLFRQINYGVSNSAGYVLDLP